MSIDSTEMARKIERNITSKLELKRRRDGEKNAKTNLALSGKFRIKMASSSSPV